MRFPFALRAGIAVVLVAAALLSLALRMTWPRLPDWQSDIERALSNGLGLAVRIEGLVADFERGHPRVSIARLQATPDATGPASLVLDRVTLVIDPVESLVRFAPVFSRLDVGDGSVSLEAGEDGAPRLAGAQPTPAGGPLPAVEGGRIALSRVAFRRAAQATPFVATDVSLILEEGLVVTAAQGQVTLSGAATGAVEFAAEWRGVERFRLWLASRALDVATPVTGPGPPLFRALQARGALWVAHDGAGETVIARLDALDLQPGDAAARALSLTGTLSAGRGYTGWRVWGHEVRFAADDITLVLPRLLAELHTASPDTPPSFTVETGGLDLADLAQVIRPALAAGDLARWLDATRPHGRLDRLALLFAPAQGGISTFRYRARAHGLGLGAWEAVPGIDGLDVTLDGDLEGFTLALDGEAVAVDAARWFSRPLPAARTRGQVRMRRDANGWSVSSDDLRHTSPYLDAHVRLGITATADQPVQLDLGISALGLDLAQVERYLPDRLMSPGVYGWLEKAFVAGRGADAQVLIHGPARGFPWRDGSGRFEALLNIEDTTLDYTDGWPRIEGMAAELLFDGPGLTVTTRAGRLYTADMAGTVARIADMPRDAILEIDGRLEGPLADGLRYVAESPLRANTGGFIDGLDGGGNARYRMQLRLPLDGVRPARLDSTLQLDGSRLRLPWGGLELSGLKGDLKITGDGLNANKINGILEGAPVWLSIATSTRGEGMVISAGGRATAERLRKRLEHPWLARANGHLDWQLRVGLPPTGVGRPPTIELRSDLAGMAIDLPAPLGKGADETVPLTLTYTAAPAVTERLLVARLGDRLGARMTWEETPQGVTPRALSLSLGADEAPVLNRGLRLTGRVATLDVATWKAVLAELPKGGLAPLTADLALGALLWDGHRFDDLAVTVHEGGKGWLLGLKSPEAEGTVRIPADVAQAPLVIRLDRLHLPKPAEPADPARLPDPDTATDPRQFPSLDGEVADFRIGEARYGRMTVRTRPVDDGQTIERFALESEAFTVAGQGDWRRIGETPRTTVDLVMEAPNVEGVMTAFGHPGGGLSGEKPRITLAGHWTGAPWDFALGRIDGPLALTIGKGRIEEVQPGVVGRLIGLISLPGLTRRLTLDFSDLLGKGLAYDTLEGRYRLADGQAHTERFRLDGPALELRVEGRMGLVQRDYDLIADVTPRLTSALPVAGAVAINPAVGAALLLADKLIGKEVSRITRVRYRITGPADAPVVERIAVFGAEGSSGGAGEPAAR